MSEEQITGTEYEPDTSLEELLTGELETTEVSYNSDEEIELPGGLSAYQRKYEMKLDSGGGEFILKGTETTSPIGMFVSLEGNLGFASGIVLNHALILGEPTQAYTDEAISVENPAETYQDLTAEWYRPDAVENGFPEARLANRIGDFEHTEVSIEELERYARHWLSRG